MLFHTLKRDTQRLAHGLVDFDGDFGFGLFEGTRGRSIKGRHGGLVLSGNGGRIEVVQLDGFGADHVRDRVFVRQGVSAGDKVLFGFAIFFVQDLDDAGFKLGSDLDVFRIDSVFSFSAVCVRVRWVEVRRMKID